MPATRDPHPTAGPAALTAAGRYLAAILVLNLVWETLQLPLYTLGSEGRIGAQALAVLHCTGGDLLIAASGLALAWLAVGRGRWPLASQASVAALTILIGLAYTVYSEWQNVAVRGSWAYSSLMPVLPLGFFSVGLSPLAQWLIVPVIGFRWLYRGAAPTHN
ncbi:MAG: hypothetical protein JSS20_00360 [Proteobacteria bacterium]|nr:hypothetical protein [Pseudomonadota bacterium]